MPCPISCKLKCSLSWTIIGLALFPANLQQFVEHSDFGLLLQHLYLQLDVLGFRDFQLALQSCVLAVRYVENSGEDLLLFFLFLFQTFFDCYVDDLGLYLFALTAPPLPPGVKFGPSSQAHG